MTTQVHRFHEPVAAVAEGRTVRFGPLAVDSSGLHDRGRVVPWHSIESFQVWQGATRVQAARGHRVRSYSVTQIPNVFVLVVVAETLRLAASEAG